MEIIPGLEGVAFTETKLSSIDGQVGKLAYCGYDIFDLAEKATYEEIAFLLWYQRLPAPSELKMLTNWLNENRTLPKAVWGIMHALQSLGGSAMLSMDMVAGPVSEALVATAVGLFAAIPAAAAYNLLVRWLRRISSMTAGNLREMCDVILFSEGGSNGRIS